MKTDELIKTILENENKLVLRGEDTLYRLEGEIKSYLFDISFFHTNHPVFYMELKNIKVRKPFSMNEIVKIEKRDVSKSNRKKLVSLISRRYDEDSNEAEKKRKQRLEEGLKEISW